MRTIKSICLASLMLIGSVFYLSGCSSDSHPSRNLQLTVDPAVVASSNDFALRCNQELAGKAGAKNSLFSPVSLYLVLSMLYNGAEGTAKDEIAQTLGVQQLTQEQLNAANANMLTILQQPDPRATVNIANAVWFDDQYQLQDEFARICAQYYRAETQNVNFADAPAAAGTINQWVNTQTQGEIPELVSANDITPDTALMLANTLLFKGKWTHRFDSADTTDQAFTLANGQDVTVPMMHLTTDLPCFETMSFQAVSLPYGDKYISMYVFVPRSGKTLAEILPQFTEANWNLWLPNFHTEECELALPKFNATSSYNLNETLQTLGMNAVFQGGLTHMVAAPANDLFLDKIMQKVVLQVDEAGTTAAAATYGDMVPVSLPIRVTVNKPFLIAIVDKPTGAILFMGTMMDPSAE